MTEITLRVEKLLDEVGWKLLRALQEEARLSFAELGRRVGLTLPAVAERVRRMEEAGLITGYHAAVDPGMIGRPITVFIRISVPADRYPAFIDLARALPELLECHHLTGADAFIVRAVVTSIPHLEKLIGRLSPYGQTATSIVLSSPVSRRVLGPEAGRPE